MTENINFEIRPNFILPRDTRIPSETRAECAVLTLWPNVYISFWGVRGGGCVASLLERLDLDHTFYDS